MALNDIPKFQAAVSEDSGLQEKMKAAIKSMTDGVGLPLTQESNIDWSPLTGLAKELGFEFSVDEIKEALFGGGRELSEDELDAAVGAGGLFSMASFGNFGSKIGIADVKGGVNAETIHGVSADTIHGVGKDGLADTIHGMGSDTIHGKG